MTSIVESLIERDARIAVELGKLGFTDFNNNMLATFLTPWNFRLLVSDLGVLCIGSVCCDAALTDLWGHGVYSCFKCSSPTDVKGPIPTMITRDQELDAIANVIGAQFGDPLQAVLLAETAVAAVALVRNSIWPGKIDDRRRTV